MSLQRSTGGLYSSGSYASSGPKDGFQNPVLEQQAIKLGLEVNPSFLTGLYSNASHRSGSIIPLNDPEQLYIYPGDPLFMYENDPGTSEGVCVFSTLNGQDTNLFPSSDDLNRGIRFIGTYDGIDTYTVANKANNNEMTTFPVKKSGTAQLENNTSHLYSGDIAAYSSRYYNRIESPFRKKVMPDSEWLNSHPNINNSRVYPQLRKWDVDFQREELESVFLLGRGLLTIETPFDGMRSVRTLPRNSSSRDGIAMSRMKEISANFIVMGASAYCNNRIKTINGDKNERSLKQKSYSEVDKYMNGEITLNDFTKNISDIKESMDNTDALRNANNDIAGDDGDDGEDNNDISGKQSKIFKKLRETVEMKEVLSDLYEAAFWNVDDSDVKSYTDSKETLLDTMDMILISVSDKKEMFQDVMSLDNGPGDNGDFMNAINTPIGECGSWLQFIKSTYKNVVGVVTSYSAPGTAVNVIMTNR